MSKGTISSTTTPSVAKLQLPDIQEHLEKEYSTLSIRDLVNTCHLLAVANHWWHEEDGTPKELNFGERIALMHSELSEGLEGFRKNLPSDHIPGFSMVEEEFADTMIRIADTAQAMKMDLNAAIKAKLLYNLTRPDHKIENRNAEGGKKF